MGLEAVALGSVAHVPCGQEQVRKEREGGGETSQSFGKSCPDRNRGWEDSRHGVSSGSRGGLTRTAVSAERRPLTEQEGLQRPCWWLP